MEFSIFHRILEVRIVDVIDHGADLLDNFRFTDDRSVKVVGLRVLSHVGRWEYAFNIAPSGGL
jgi:hypothetical protein